MLKIICDAEGCASEAEIEFEHHLPPRWVKMEFQVPEKAVASVPGDSDDDSDDDSNGEAALADDEAEMGPYLAGRVITRLRHPGIPLPDRHTHATAVICPNHDLPAVKGSVLASARRRIGYMIGA